MKKMGVLLGEKTEILKVIQVLWVATVLGLASFIILMDSPYNLWKPSVAGIDSNVFKYVAMVMSKGGMPYKDAFDHKGPLLYLINYWGNCISYYRGIWIIEAVFMLASVTFLYKTARLFCNRYYSIVCVVISITPMLEYFEAGNYSEEYALSFISVALYIFTDYFFNNNISKMRLIVCGMTFAGVFLLRQNMIALWIVFCISVLVYNVKKRKIVPWEFLIWFLVGALLVAVPIMFWIIRNGAFSDFVKDYFIFNFRYTPTQSEFQNQYESLLRWLQNPVCLLAMSSIVVFIHRKENVHYNVTYVFFMILTIYFIVMSGRNYGHYGMVLIPTYIYPISFLCRSNNKDASSSSRQYFLFVFVVAFLLPLWIPRMSNAVDKICHPCHEPELSYDQENIIRIIRDSTDEDEGIMVLGHLNYFYVLSNKLATSKYSYQTGIGIAEGNEEDFKEEFLATRPRIVLVAEGAGEFYNKSNYELIYIGKYDKTLELYRLKE